MKLKELEKIVFDSSSDVVRKEGQRAFNKGYAVEIKGKRIDNIYYIYGRVRDDGSVDGFNTHIQIDMVNKRLKSTKCSCKDFREHSNVPCYMCRHLAGMVYKFFSLASKGKSDGNEEPEDTPNHHREIDNPIRITRKMLKNPVCYEVQQGSSGQRATLQANELRAFLEGVESKNIKFKYEHIEFDTSILKKDLPITFTVKIKGDKLLLTTHKQLPVPLSSNNDVYLFNWKLYLPSKNQIVRYMPLYEKFKKNDEILFNKNIDNYNKLIALLRAISNNINISEEAKSFASGFIKPEFYLYVHEESIYCDVHVIYGNKKINILADINSNRGIIRDFKAESRIIAEIEKCRFIRHNDRFLFIGGDEELFNILTNRENTIRTLGNVNFDEKLKEVKLISTASIDAAICENNGHIDFSYNIKDFDNKELNSALTAYKLGNRFYRTKNHDYLDFEDEGVRSFFELFEILNIKKGIDNGLTEIEKNKGLFLNEAIKSSDINFIRGTEILEKLCVIDNKDIPVPKDLNGVLREYQISGYRWLKGLNQLGFGGILADEMGLGKTIQTIAFILSEKNKKTIIVSPTSLIYNWKDEIERFAPTLSIGVIHGEKAERLKIINSLDEYDVLLTTYGTLKMDIELYKDVVFDYCFIDEGQNIKNASALNTIVIKELKADLRFALTGTPIENNLTELWSIFDYIMPGYLYYKDEFEEKFVSHEENLDKLKLLIKPFILRRTKQEVMKELPSKIEKKFLVEMTTAQKAVYKSYVENVKEKMKNGKDGKIEVFSYLTRLRQICLDPSLIAQDYKGGSGKLKVVLALIKDHIESGGKLLLFSQFTSVLKKIGSELQKNKIDYLTLDGTTNPKQRINMVNEFNNSSDKKVFLISLKAGGTGLNLTAANLVIHYDPWWNPAVEDQATDRAHRIGQKNIVNVIKLVAKGTIEEKIILLQEDKKDLINSIITGELKDGNLLNKLSKEELMEIMTGM